MVAILHSYKYPKILCTYIDILHSRKHNKNKIIYNYVNILHSCRHSKKYRYENKKIKNKKNKKNKRWSVNTLVFN